MSKIRKKFIPNPELDPSKSESASSTEGLWVVAMEIYDRVAKAVTVAPKRIKLKEAEKELRESVEILKYKRAELKEVIFISYYLVQYNLFEKNLYLLSSIRVSFVVFGFNYKK